MNSCNSLRVLVLETTTEGNEDLFDLARLKPTMSGLHEFCLQI